MKEWLDRILREINRYQLSTSAAGTAFKSGCGSWPRDPYGETKTYIGRPRIFLVVQQAVGQAVGRNPLTILSVLVTV